MAHAAALFFQHEEMMDIELHSKAREHIIGLMLKTGKPLTDEQEVTLAGALAVWITKAQEDGRKDALDSMRDSGIVNF